MNIFNQIISEKVSHALGWTVLHAMWQVSLLALIMAIILWFLKDKSAKLRYTLGCATLFLMLGISQVTFLYQFLNYKTIEKENATCLVKSVQSATDDSFLPLLSNESNWSEKVVTYLNEHIEFIVAFWIIGFIFFAIRLFGGLNYISKIRQTAQYDIDDKWKFIVKNLANRFPIQKSIQLAESAMVQVPMVLGYFKPLILFPIGALNQLEQKEVEAILAHELGHVFRNDYLINILQSIVDVCFYFHPAAWWISAQIRMERENCCDDLAIEITDCSLTYAKALVQIQERSTSIPMMAMAIKKDNKQLLNRIKRILNQPTQNTHTMEKLITSCLLLFLIFGLTINASTPADRPSFDENDTAILQDMTQLTTQLDTIIPGNEKKLRINSGSNNKAVIVKKTDKEDIKFSMENGEITNLKIDGKKIDKSDYHKHQELIDDLIGNLPTPPVPPSSPTIGNKPNQIKQSIKTNKGEKTIQRSDNKNNNTSSFPDIDLPPTPPVPPTPPTPPAPPSNAGGMSSDEAVILKKNEDGKIVIEINAEESDKSFDISVNGNEVYLNGEQLLDVDFTSIDNDIMTDELENAIILENTSRINAINLDSLIENSFDFEGYIDDNKYSKSLSKIHRDYNLKIHQLKKEGRFPEDIEKATRAHSIEIEKKVESLNKKYRAHVDQQRASIEKTREKAKLARAQRMLNDDLYQQKLANSLLEDGLIDSVRDFKFQLKNEHMKVNGKKYTGPLFEKYFKMYEDTKDMKITRKFNYSLQNNGSL